MAIYTVFESTNMGSTHYAERIMDAVCDVDLENGMFGYLDGLAEGQSHIYNFKVGTKKGAKVVVVDQPAWNEDECRKTNQRRDQFHIPAGQPFRCRVVKVYDEFAISIEGVTPATREAMKVGAHLTIDNATGRLVAAAAAAEDAVMDAEVMRQRVMGGTLMTPIRNYASSKVMYTAKINVLA